MHMYFTRNDKDTKIDVASDDWAWTDLLRKSKTTKWYDGIWLKTCFPQIIIMYVEYSALFLVSDVWTSWVKVIVISERLHIQLQHGVFNLKRRSFVSLNCTKIDQIVLWLDTDCRQQVTEIEYWL